ncbi:MAG TPA: GGDEF domain-containing protein, partial [Bacilli bacterium]
LQTYNFSIDLYLLLLVFLGYYLVSPRIGQYIKYQFGLTLFLVIQVSHMVNTYILQKEQAVFSLMENFLPIVYYMTLFLILFERVVELLQAVYASSITDGLTGLFTRHYMLNRLNQMLLNRGNVSVIFGDIDNFKKLNDTKGHLAGDNALKQAARIMQEESEGIGIVGRYGGEELMVLVDDASLRVENLAERIRRRIAAETGVTISLGYSKSKKGCSASELIMQADQAMYMSKKSGKNRVTGYRQAAE